MDGGGVNDELVVGGTAGVLTGGDDQSARVAQGAFAAAQGCFRQLCRGEISIDRFGTDDAQLFDAIGFHICSIASLFTMQDLKSIRMVRFFICVSFSIQL